MLMQGLRIDIHGYRDARARWDQDYQETQEVNA
jgi:hypothetical protein